ncbi:MAG: trigger factor [Hespellia sp.]|nr:trigger factor [Hespellia sp.]
MKKKMMALILSIGVVGSLAGCSGGKLSNDYITITQYNGLEVAQVERVEVTDEMLDAEIENRLNTAEEVLHRASQAGDTVNIDFTGTIDGVEFEGGKAEGTNLEIGSGAMIGPNGNYKGFEEQLIGYIPGDEFTITVQFPDPYERNPEMSGVVADFAIKMNNIYLMESAELTDDWVKENSEESKTVEEYKEEVKKELEKLYNASADEVLKIELIEALVNKTEVTELPKEDVEAQTKEMRKYYEDRAEEAGMELPEYLETYMNLKEEEFTREMKAVAEETVKQRLAIDLLAEKKKLKPSEDEYEKKYKQYVKDYNFESVDNMKELVGEDVLRDTVLQDIVAEYLMESCVQVEQNNSGETE